MHLSSQTTSAVFNRVVIFQYPVHVSSQSMVESVMDPGHFSMPPGTVRLINGKLALCTSGPPQNQPAANASRLVRGRGTAQKRSHLPASSYEGPERPFGV